MHRAITLAIAGLVAGCFSLAAPSVSQAQGISFGLQIQRGGYYNGYSPGYYGRGYGGYVPSPGGYYGGGYGSSRYGGYDCDRGYGRQPVIVHPEYRHWTPNRGWHDHGHIHIPHRDHYHTRPY